MDPALEAHLLPGTEADLPETKLIAKISLKTLSQALHRLLAPGCTSGPNISARLPRITKSSTIPSKKVSQRAFSMYPLSILRQVTLGCAARQATRLTLEPFKCSEASPKTFLKPRGYRKAKPPLSAGLRKPQRRVSDML